MSIEKAILHGKEKRKPYRGAKAVDCWCRNHGSCSWCVSNRRHKFTKRETAAQAKQREYPDTRG
jgi:hypothetical protein